MLDKDQLVLQGTLLFSLLISLLVEFWVRSCGFIMTPDSYNYISASQSFRSDFTFLSPDETRFSNWPPLFPMFLSLFKNPSVAMSVCHVICKVVVAIFLLIFANQFLKQQIFKGFFILTFFLSVHLLLISVFLWSEIIFITLLVLHIYTVLRMQDNRFFYFTMLLSGFLLCLQRNAGVFCILAITVWIMTDENKLLPKRILQSVIYFSVCSLGLWIWHFYNVFLPDSLPFYERDFFSDIFTNVQFMLSVIGSAFLPFRKVPAMISGLLIIIVLIFCWRRYFIADRFTKLLVLVIAIYLMGFLPIPNLEINDMERYFAIILPFILLLSLMILERLIKVNRYPIVLTICLCIWLIYPTARMYRNALQWRSMSCSSSITK